MNHTTLSVRKKIIQFSVYKLQLYLEIVTSLVSFVQKKTKTFLQRITVLLRSTRHNYPAHSHCCLCHSTRVNILGAHVDKEELCMIQASRDHLSRRCGISVRLEPSLGQRGDSTKIKASKLCII